VETIMEEKIKKAFDEWKNSDKQPKESNVTEESKTGVLSKQLMAYIEAHPGVTGKQLRAVVAARSPETPVSYVPALLKGMYDKKLIRRDPVWGAKDGGMGRPTFAYYKLSDEERKQQMKPRKVKAKTIKAKPKNEGITTLVLDAPKQHAAHPLEVGTTTVSISIATADGTTYSLLLSEAKVIYSQLNQIFGATR
jgi:hypothetical protein